MSENIRNGFVETEGDRLYYEVRGEGTPLLMIPAAGGDGDYYAPVADLLGDRFQVITYDRRANARSTMNQPQNFEISQQSRDAVAVLSAAGAKRAVVFGNSSGGVIALDMAKTQPQAVLAAIVHEPATPSVLPDARKWGRFFAQCYLTAYRLGSSLGAVRFMTGARLPLQNLAKAQRRAAEYAKKTRPFEDAPRISVKAGLDFLMKQELLPVTRYAPDTGRIRQSGVPMFIGVGEGSKTRTRWIAEVCRILAEALGCPLVTFPGDHGGYMEEPEVFAAVLRDTLLPFLE